MPGTHNTNDEYVANLENVIRQMLNPLRGIPFNLVIETMAWHSVIWYDSNNQEHRDTLELLKRVAISACNTINEVWIHSARANEVWNKTEEFIKNAFHELWLFADIPVNTSWRRVASGYPDIEFQSESWSFYYVECKTYSIETIDSTQRTFYLSPSANPKITRDTIHFVISLETYHEWNNIYKTHWWKILSLKDLLVNVKYEFNANNVDLYWWNLVIAEWRVD